MATELDIGLSFSLSDFRAEDKNEKFDLKRAKLASTLRSPSFFFF